MPAALTVTRETGLGILYWRICRALAEGQEMAKHKSRRL